MSQSVIELGRIVGRILSIVEEGEKLVASHKRRRVDAARLVEVSHYNGGKDMQEAAREIHRRLVGEVTQLAEQEGREMELKMAAELETLRAYLPGIAAKAAVEAGVIARRIAAKETTA